MNRQRLHDLGARLREGDREAAFRMQQRLRGRMSATVMKARGYPNLVKAREKRRARLTTSNIPATRTVEPGARLSPSPPAVEPRHIRCWWCGFGQMSAPSAACIACKRSLY